MDSRKERSKRLTITLGLLAAIITLIAAILSLKWPCCRQYEIKGTVVEESTEKPPVPNVNIEVLSGSFKPASNTTDAKGHFTIAVTSDRDKVEVRFSADGYTPKTYTLDASSSTVKDEIIPIKKRSISATVIENSKDGSPVANARIEILSESKTVPVQIMTDKNGFFEIPAPSKESQVKVRISADGYYTIQELPLSIATPKSVIPIQKKRPIPPPEPDGEKKIPYVGYDPNGKSADLMFHNIGTAGEKHSWEYGSTTTVTTSDKKITPASDFLKTYFKGKSHQGKLERAVQIFALGVASCEGEVKPEEERARLRAIAIRTAIQEEMDIKGKNDVQLVLLGQYQGQGKDCDPSSKNTAHQRSIVVITVEASEDGADVKAVIKDAFVNAYKDEDFKKNLRQYLSSKEYSPIGHLELTRYSCFEVGKDAHCTN
jgi:hypothetical protein